MVRKTALALIALSATTAQAQSTNCMAIGPNMVHCDTTGGQSRYVDTDWAAAFQHIHDRHVKKKIGKLIVAGDCQGAYTYALQESLDLAARVREICSPPVPR